MSAKINPCLWLRNLKTTLETRPVVILHGNVRDRYIDESGRVFENLTGLLVELSRSLPGSFSETIFYDHVAGERKTTLHGNTKVAPQATGNAELDATRAERRTGERVPPERVFATWVGQLRARDQNRFVVAYYLDKLVAYKKNGYQDNEKEVLLWLEKAVENITENHRLILVALEDTMIPLELYTNSPKTAVVPVPLPNQSDRRRYLEHRLAERGNRSGARAQLDNFKLICDLTDGLFLRDLDRIAQPLAGRLHELSSREVSQIVNKYRIGEQEDYWGQLSVAALDGATDWFTERVKGQNDAIRKLTDTLCVARAGLSGMASGTPSKPKGVLFFAGPTGVGKTLLAKKLAEFLFGTEEAFLRFDMSEFKEEHTVSKLIGSPPGYVGFERGGLLTNRVRERPFSVILFDEIEKAHPKIMDIYLQILDDGRLTDSRGQTVFFTETLIIFTTNLGTRSKDSQDRELHEKAALESIVNNAELPDEVKKQKVQQHFKDTVTRFFTTEISRPELMNRIGNNIVPFNYIDSAEVQREIIQTHLQRMTVDYADKYRTARHQLVFDDNVVEWILTQRSEGFKTFGARGITNALAEDVSPLLARATLRAEERGYEGAVFRCVLNEEGSVSKLEIREV